jgi:hypothetical protein
LPLTPKTIIPAVLLTASIITGGIFYTKNHNNVPTPNNNDKTSSLLYYSKTDVSKVKDELKQLKVRSYSDLDWGKNGRIKYFDTWQKINQYNFYPNLPQKCDTRFAVLVTQGNNVKHTNCDIISGIWINPYTNETITDSSKIDIDHIIPLKNAWSSGAYLWKQDKRVKYANAPNILIISDIKSNRTKGDKSPDKWLPSENKCGYMIKWIYIKFDYGLSVTKSEKDTLNTKINTC